MHPNGIELIQSFILVAEELNFRRAAGRMNVDQSVLTRRVQKLEKLVGCPLLERTTRQVSLTAAGRVFLEENSNLVRNYESAVLAARRVSKGMSGILRVGYMAFAATSILPRAAAAFQANNPDLELQLHYKGTQGQKLALQNDEIDIGLLIGPFEHAEISSVVVSSEPLYVCMPKGHALCDKAAVRIDDLAEVDLIIGDTKEWSTFQWWLKERFTEHGLAFQIKHAAPNTLAIMGLVRAGLGVTVYTKNAAEWFDGRIEMRPIKNKGFEIDTILAWRRSNNSRPVQTFVELVKSNELAGIPDG